MGNFEEPIRISTFVKDVFAGFSMVDHHFAGKLHSMTATQLNLKNDTLRRRYDSLKYDLKKIEEGDDEVSRLSSIVVDQTPVVYDISLRNLHGTKGQEPDATKISE